MTIPFDDGSLERLLARFRDQAEVVRDRANRQFFMLLSVALISVCALYVAMILWRTPQSALLWPVSCALVAGFGLHWWARSSGRYGPATIMLAALMLTGICAVILVQRGSNAAAVIYGLTTVAVVLIAGFVRVGSLFGAWLAVWTAAVTWATSAGLISNAADNPFGADQARVLALLVAIILIGSAARISQSRRRGLEALLESALELTEAERDDARRLAERRERTVAELGHEIRTPMTGIVGAAQLLARQSMSPVQQQLLSIQRQSAERLLNLVTAVLDEAKAQAGPTAPPRREAYSLQQVTSEVIELFAPQAHRKGVEVIWTATPEVPHVLLGDSMRVRQILSNLVSNAVKFTEHGVVHVRLLTSPPDRLRVEVHDTGAGIDAADIDTIFDRFVSAAPAAERAFSTGLGLPICRELARAMGGDVTAGSQAGNGSCFVFELACEAGDPAADGGLARPEKPPPGRVWVVGASAPLQIQLEFLLGEMDVDARFVDHLPSAAEWSEGASQPQAIMIDAWVGHGRRVDLLPSLLGGLGDINRRVIVINSVAQDAALGVFDAVWQLFRPPRWISMREALLWAFSARDDVDPPAARSANLRVLLVDDNPVNQIVGKAMLELIGAEVKLVGNGRAAVEATHAETFDLILMDLQMPDMDGLEATRRLRLSESRRGAKRIPVIAVTGQAGLDVEAQCRAVGMDALLLKPYTSSQLHKIVAVHCGKALASRSYP